MCLEGRNSLRTDRRIVITGPTGAIGMALIRRCMEEKIHVEAVCHIKSSRIAQIPQDPYVHIVEADLADLRRLDRKDLGLAERDRVDTFYHFVI